MHRAWQLVRFGYDRPVEAVREETRHPNKHSISIFESENDANMSPWGSQKVDHMPSSHKGSAEVESQVSQ